LQHFEGLRVLEPIHVDPRGCVGWLDVKLGHDVLNLIHLKRSRQHDQRVGPLVGNDFECGPAAGRSRRNHANSRSLTSLLVFARTHDLLDFRSQLTREGQLERDYRHVLLHSLDIQAADYLE
jgi:hypothetical protein